MVDCLCPCQQYEAGNTRTAGHGGPVTARSHRAPSGRQCAEAACRLMLCVWLPTGAATGWAVRPLKTAERVVRGISSVAIIAPAGARSSSCTAGGMAAGSGDRSKTSCAVLHFEDLQDVTLVGHSYGGFVIAGVASRMTDRIASLVHLDASVPTTFRRLPARPRLASDGAALPDPPRARQRHRSRSRNRRTRLRGSAGRRWLLSARRTFLPYMRAIPPVRGMRSAQIAPRSGRSEGECSGQWASP